LRGLMKKEEIFSEEKIVMDFGDIIIKKSRIGQFKDGLGAFAGRDFKKGEILIRWNLKILTNDEYHQLPEYEKNNFCHKRKGVLYFYPDPERHVNRSKDSGLCNVVPDFEKQMDIAHRDIKRGEELVMLDSIEEDF
jgi:hypothetical protein